MVFNDNCNEILIGYVLDRYCFFFNHPQTKPRRKHWNCSVFLGPDGGYDGS